MVKGPRSEGTAKSYQSSDPVSLESDKRGVVSKLASRLETSTIKLENHDYSSILRVTFTLLLLREGPGMSRPNVQQESKSYQSSDPVNLDSDKRGVWSKLASRLETSTIKLENHDYSSILRVAFTLLLLREGPGMSRPLILILTKGEWSLRHRGWKTLTIKRRPNFLILVSFC